MYPTGGISTQYLLQITLMQYTVIRLLNCNEIYPRDNKI